MTLQAPISLDTSKPWHGEEMPSLAHVPEPQRWLVIVKQLGIRRKIGSIELPDQLVDAQSYTHGLGIVVKVGSAVYKGRKFEDLGLSPEDGPKAGEIVMFEARGQPRRFKVDGIELMFIMDDSITASVLPEQAAFVSFNL